MPSLPDSSNDSSNTSSGYLSYPVKYAVNSAIRRFSADPFSTSRSHSRDPISSASSFSNLAALDASNHTPPTSATPEPARAHTSFQPPPLTPLTLSGAKPGTVQILATQLAEEIRLLVPPRLQLVDSWRLIFSLEQDGSSLSTLFDKCSHFEGRRGGFVVVARDTGGGIFGAYLTDAPRPSNGHYYGHGECFLWRCSTLDSIPTLANLPPPPSADTTHAQRMTTIASPTSPHGHSNRRSWDRSSQQSENLIDFGDDESGDADEFGSFKGHDDDDFGDFEGPAQSTTVHAHSVSDRNREEHYHNTNTNRHSGTSTPERIRFKAFPYSGENDYLIFCEHGFLSVGGGYVGQHFLSKYCKEAHMANLNNSDGHYGLWLDASLEKGISEHCPTFGNERLSDDGAKFDVMGVEVWYLGA